MRDFDFWLLISGCLLAGCGIVLNIVAYLHVVPDHTLLNAVAVWVFAEISWAIAYIWNM